jgi:uncharacterized small protein (DUF1192 family)
MSDITPDAAIKYAANLEGQENLSPNEIRIMVLAKEVERLRYELKQAKGAKPARISHRAHP